jgi:hypothetical protein
MCDYQLLVIPWHPDAPCLTRDDLHWQSPNLCERTAAAAACIRCPVVIQCAQAALTRGERTSVWGGLDLDTAASDTKYDTFLAHTPGRTRHRARELWHRKGVAVA